MQLRRIVIALGLLGVLMCTGCFTYDTRHNSGHWEAIKNDFRLMHQDIDFFLALDEPSYLDRTGR